ncbi:MAG: hypothetical protein IH593_07940 [Bacteroidales bacterium]|nr:hypothetical protein [Bacteroidales bacterium]
MRLRELFILSRGTKVIIGITFSVSVVAILFAFFYYRSINNAADPRVMKAREMLYEYDKASGKINSFEAFPFLDTAEAVYRSFPDYESSFEIGLIYNNRCSALLLMAVYDSTISESEKSILLTLAMKYCDSSIMNYRRWIAEWEKLSSEEITSRVVPFMDSGDPVFKGIKYSKVLSGRIKYILTAQTETPRRLSVSLSNKGTIYRHTGFPDSALYCYREALTLWSDNRTAESNLSVLMGGEPVTPSLIQTLFPPDKGTKR